MLCCRKKYFTPRSDSLHPLELVLHSCGLHRSWINHFKLERILCSTYPYSPECNVLHGEIYGRNALLQEMPSSKTRPSTSLLNMRQMCFEDGSSLSVACNLCRPLELQILSVVSYIYHTILPPLCGSCRDLDVA